MDKNRKFSLERSPSYLSPLSEIIYRRYVRLFIAAHRLRGNFGNAVSSIKVTLLPHFGAMLIVVEKYCFCNKGENESSCQAKSRFGEVFHKLTGTAAMALGAGL